MNDDIPVWYSTPRWNPPPEAELGPLPARSHKSLWRQYRFQWCYLIPAFVLFAVLLVVFAANGGSSGGGGGGDLGGVILTRRQYLLESEGTAEDWHKNIYEALLEATKRADKAERRRRSKGQSAPMIQPFTQLDVRQYRGAGIQAAADIAAPLGWTVDWKRTESGTTSLYFLRTDPLGDPVLS